MGKGFANQSVIPAKHVPVKTGSGNPEFFQTASAFQIAIPAKAGIQSPTDAVRVRIPTCPNETLKVSFRRLRCARRCYTIKSIA